MGTHLHRHVILLGCICLSAGCSSFRQVALQSAADLFSGESATRVFLSEEDPALARDALPFALKTTEILLAEDPDNRDLLLSLASGYGAYAFAFLDLESTFRRADSYAEAKALRRRAARLYLRSRDYALRGLGFPTADEGSGPGRGVIAALPGMTANEVPLLYWAGVSWAAAIAARPDDMDLVADLPVAEALMRRALELDPGYDKGAIHTFFIQFEGGRGEAMGGSAARARQHFTEAVALSEGGLAAPYVALAETVAVQEQDPGRFRELLGKALSVDLDQSPDHRLANVLLQRKAEWLLDHISDYFLEVETD